MKLAKASSEKTVRLIKGRSWRTRVIKGEVVIIVVADINSRGRRGGGGGLGGGVPQQQFFHQLLGEQGSRQRNLPRLQVEFGRTVMISPYPVRPI